MNKIKNIILYFSLMFLTFSCVEGVGNIDFTSVDKGKISLDLKLSKEVFPPKEMDELLETIKEDFKNKKMDSIIDKLKEDFTENDDMNFSHKIIGEGYSDEIGNYTEYLLKADFNNLEVLNSFATNWFNVENISVIKEDKIVSVDFGYLDFIPFKFTVPGKVIEASEGAVIEGNTVYFDNFNKPVKFKYRLKKDNKLIFVGIGIGITIVLVLGVIVIRKRGKNG